MMTREDARKHMEEFAREAGRDLRRAKIALDFNIARGEDAWAEEHYDKLCDEIMREYYGAVKMYITLTKEDGGEVREAMHKIIDREAFSYLK